jgi:hypothetical protein
MRNLESMRPRGHARPPAGWAPRGTGCSCIRDTPDWPRYIAASILIALTYALIGVLLSPLFGRLGGILVPFLDLGIQQSPMLRLAPPDWAQALPGYGADRVLIDAALTPTFDETGPLLIALAWLAGLALAAAALFHRAVVPAANPSCSSIDQQVLPAH